jgi:hypothetical protein
VRQWSEIEFEPKPGVDQESPILIECATPHCKNAWDMVIPGVVLSVEQSSRKV